MSSYLDDFIRGDILHIQGHTSQDLSWYDGVPESLKRVLIDDIEADVDLGDVIIRPETGRGIRIVSGEGSLTGGHVEYPEGVVGYGNYGVEVLGSWLVTQTTVTNPQIGILLSHFGSEANLNHVFNAEEDHIRFMSGGVKVINNVCKGHSDNGSKNHRDCIQGVAGNYGVDKTEFLDNPIIDVEISGNHLSSNHPDAQGVMFSDGVAVDWDIFLNKIEVLSTHGITLNRAQAVNVFLNYTDSYVNIGSRKHSDIISSSVGLTNNICKDIRLVSCDRSVIDLFESNTTLDGTIIEAATLV